MADESKLVVNGREYAVPDTFTLGELADIEKITGQGYDLKKPGILGTLALVYIAIRREDETVTVDDIRDLGPDDFELVNQDPPAVAAQSSGDTTEKPPLSPDDSTTTSDASDSHLNGTGSPGSAAFAVSESPT